MLAAARASFAFPNKICREGNAFVAVSFLEDISQQEPLMTVALTHGH